MALPTLFSLLSKDNKPITIPAPPRNTVFALIGLTSLLAVGCFHGLGHFTANKQLEQQVARLTTQLRETDSREQAALREQIAILQQQLAEAREALIARAGQQENRIKRGGPSADHQQQGRTAVNMVLLDNTSKKRPSAGNRTEADVAIKEDPSHSGGLFIEPSKKKATSVKLEDFNKSLDVMASLPLGKPVPTEISSAFGLRSDPLNRRAAFHLGLDFRGKIGDPVVATGSGLVKESGYRTDYGEYLLIAHKQGVDTFFAHLSKRLVKAGDRIDRGQRIGMVGKTGRSTGAHLHYEVHLQGRPVNPLQFVRGNFPRKQEQRVQRVAQLTTAGKRAVR